LDYVAVTLGLFVAQTK